MFPPTLQEMVAHTSPAVFIVSSPAQPSLYSILEIDDVCA